MTGDTKLSDRAGEAKGNPHGLAPHVLPIYTLSIPKPAFWPASVALPSLRASVRPSVHPGCGPFIVLAPSDPPHRAQIHPACMSPSSPSTTEPINAKPPLPQV